MDTNNSDLNIDELRKKYSDKSIEELYKAVLKELSYKHYYKKECKEELDKLTSKNKHCLNCH